MATTVDLKHVAITPPYTSQRSSPESSADHPSNGRSSTATITTNTAKYKSNIMEKYLRDLQPEIGGVSLPPSSAIEVRPLADGGVVANDVDCAGVGVGRELSKWLESAANFTPDKKNYIEWEGGVR